MSEDNIFESVVSIDSKRDIVNQLINGNDNLDLKTEIEHVHVNAVLETLTNEIAQRELTKTAELLSFFTEKTYRLQLSKNRKSRTEFIAALTAISNKADEPTNEIGS